MSTQRYEDGTYLAENPEWHAHRAGWKADHVRRGLREAGLSPASLVDIGCGTGHVLEALRPHLTETAMTGVEPSSDARAMASTASPIVASIEELNATFDVMLMLDVFEHVPDYIGLLDDVRALATHHVFHIPLDLSVQNVARPVTLARRRERLGHIHYFTRELAEAALVDCGYEIVHRHYTRSSFDGPGRDAKARARGTMRRAAEAVSQDMAVRVLGGYSLLVVARSRD